MISGGGSQSDCPAGSRSSRSAREGFRYMDGVDMQDTYDVDDDEVASNDASFDAYYDAMGGDHGTAPSGIPEVRVNLDPSDRLIEAIEQLREVIIENTNTAKGGRRRGRQAQGSSQPAYRANGAPLGLKDDRLKIRREKVSLSSSLSSFN